MIFLTLIFFALAIKPSNAIVKVPTILPEPTEVATPTASPTNTVSDDIQKIREVVQQKVKEKLMQIISPSTSKKSIAGKIVEVSDKSLSIEYHNETRIIQLDPTLTIIDANRNKTTLAKLKVGQDILVLGIDDTQANTFLGKRIIVTDLSKLQIKKTVTTGKIVDMSKTSSILTLVPTHNKNTLFQIRMDTKTEYLSITQQKIKQTDVKSGHRIIAILRPDEKATKTYNAVRLIDLDYKPEPTPTKK
ncbi:hypothetical protein HYV64_05480 [Candidatus Shapirobacteria bacterium]|nr:hypothetical protein [Candidatus Shapirobacteria bacterium]